ncbi:MAG: hypothetical protein QME66_05845 [Candidatus Eisenbacteria bacterium]|nr:hypothetical protein [Candidatus Eisenbacteria bacterium]
MENQPRPRGRPRKNPNGTAKTEEIRNRSLPAGVNLDLSREAIRIAEQADKEPLETPNDMIARLSGGQNVPDSQGHPKLVDIARQVIEKSRTANDGKPQAQTCQQLAIGYYQEFVKAGVERSEAATLSLATSVLECGMVGNELKDVLRKALNQGTS